MSTRHTLSLNPRFSKIVPKLITDMVICNLRVFFQRLLLVSAIDVALA